MSGGANLESLLDIYAHRLFDEDVAARFDRVNRGTLEQVVRRRNHDAVEFFAIEHFPIVEIRALESKLIAGSDSSNFVNVSACYKLSLFHCSQLRH